MSLERIVFEEESVLIISCMLTLQQGHFNEISSDAVNSQLFICFAIIFPLSASYFYFFSKNLNTSRFIMFQTS